METFGSYKFRDRTLAEFESFCRVRNHKTSAGYYESSAENLKIISLHIRIAKTIIVTQCVIKLLCRKVL